MLLWNIFTDLIQNSLTLPVIDNLTLSHGIGGALLLSHGFTLGFIPGGAGLGSLGGARFLMESFLDGSGDINTLQFLRVVTLFFLLGRTLLTDVISCGAVPLDLKRTFSSLNLLLNRTLGNSTSSLLNIGTQCSKSYEYKGFQIQPIRSSKMYRPMRGRESSIAANLSECFVCYFNKMANISCYFLYKIIDISLCI